MAISPSTGITVISTHIGADFDAISSLFAAQKLYPEALVVLPDATERNLQNFFIGSLGTLLTPTKLTDIDFSAVSRLILVDTQSPSRIGKIGELIRPGVEIIIFDHHPTRPDDIVPHTSMIRPTGATTTILVKEIQRKNILLNANEATVLSLGIYEDTGAFSFSTTTQEDFEAASWLLAQSADLPTVASLVTQEIRPEQVHYLNDLLQNAQFYPTHGVDILITHFISDTYVPDMAFLAHKMIRMEAASALFIIAQMGSKIHIIGRSNVLAVDVGETLQLLGGGGHPFAASAILHSTSLPQAQEKLLHALDETIIPRPWIRDIMSSPAISISPDNTCEDARETLNRYNINALLIVTPEKKKDVLHGFITRQVIGKALYHHLGHVPVKEYMSTEVVTVAPDVTLDEIQAQILQNKQRVLPVIENNRIIGVLTRTDLLTTLAQTLGKKAQRTSFQTSLPPQTRNIRNLLQERLPFATQTVLKNVGQLAYELQMDAYAVGGFVRDLLLYRENEDVDIVIEGDGILFAEAFAQKYNLRFHFHKKFGTAILVFPDGFKLDIATARTEYYTSPAALPTVEKSSIRLDLFRRDFTINTLAIQLTPTYFGTLIDHFSGLRDLKAKTIRVLHNLSFVEDPTRIFRAIRFEQRFGFTIGKLTKSLLENAIERHFLDRVEPYRIFTELRLLLQESDPVPALVRLKEFRLLSVIHPKLQLQKNEINHLIQTRDVLSWSDLLFLKDSYMKWVVYFMVLIRPLTCSEKEELCQRFQLAPALTTLFTKGVQRAEYALEQLRKPKKVSNSDIYALLNGIPVELLLYMMAITNTESVKKAISTYFTQLRDLHPHVTGKDLLQLSITPGPIYHELLDAVLAARLDGSVETREEELELVQNLLRENGS